MHTPRRRFLFTLAWTLVLVALLATPAHSLGQQSLAPEALTAEVATLSAGARTVFVGQIVSVHRTPGVVEVSFRVEQMLRGTVSPATAAGETASPLLVLREWAGMWPPGQQRYLPGTRVLAFLHGVSPAGFASPVHGSEGLVPVLVQGAGRSPLVDLRRVAASVVRGSQTPLPSLAEAAVPLNALLPVISMAAPAGGLGGVAGGTPARLTPSNGLTRSLQARRGSLPVSQGAGVNRHAAL